MPTAQQIINDAHSHLGVLPAGATLGLDLSTLGLATLNRLLDGWTAEQIAVNGQTVQTIALSGAASYPLATRPVKVESASVTDAAGVEQLAPLVTAKEWSQIPDKTRTGGFAEAAWYDAGIPTANIYLTPKPAAGSLQLRVIAPIAALGSLSSSVVVPPGVEKALVYNLAVDLAASLEKPVPPSVAALAAATKDALKTLSADVFGLPSSLAAQAGVK